MNAMTCANGRRIAAQMTATMPAAVAKIAHVNARVGLVVTR
jgi:hypothetical protein